MVLMLKKEANTSNCVASSPDIKCTTNTVGNANGEGVLLT